MRIGEFVLMDLEGLDALIKALQARGYLAVGPTVVDGAIVARAIPGADALPRGYHDEQAPGHYRLTRDDTDERVFAWAVGPGGFKEGFFPPAEVLWRAERVAADEDQPGAPQEGPTVRVRAEPPTRRRPLALVGLRPCEVAALSVLDRVLAGGNPDPGYVARRRGAFVVVAECATPAGTCFCSSFGTGPDADGAFDLALCELEGQGLHRFAVRVGSELGADLLAEVHHVPASSAELDARRALLERARAAMGRSLDTDDLPGLLERNIDHPRWAETARRCLACGNCTLVCPTCFCSDLRDVSDVRGTMARERRWASCFDLEHSYLHGGSVRPSVAARYRQWMTHKLSSWWAQFGTSGCVGCGRCITWCPVGIDLTEEAAQIRLRDGERSVAATGEERAS